VKGLGFTDDELERMLQEMPDVDLEDLTDQTNINGESEYMVFRMSVRKAEKDEVERAAESDWGDPDLPTGQAERIGALFLHLWRTYGGQ
jgi:hypothetical protein